MDNRGIRVVDRSDCDGVAFPPRGQGKGRRMKIIRKSEITMFEFEIGKRTETYLLGSGGVWYRGKPSGYMMVSSGVTLRKLNEAYGKYLEGKD
jgi:hypothetical protein